MRALRPIKVIFLFSQSGVKQFQAELRVICSHEEKATDGHIGVAQSGRGPTQHTYITCRALCWAPGIYDGEDKMLPNQTSFSGKIFLLEEPLLK